jgi:FKBP-type peptidyl-prolyl cis-trans isomerase FkpA
MNLKKQLLLIASAGLLAAGCGSADFKKNKEGLVYKIISDGKGEQIKPGQLLKLNFSSQIGDSVMFSTFDHIPAYGKYDTMPQTAYDFIDFLGEMKIGDSAEYVRSVDTMVNRKMLQYGGPFKKGGTIKGYVKVIGSFKTEADMSADHEKEVQVEKTREVANLEKLLKEKGITNAVKTTNGVFVLMEREGTGTKADSGMKVTVNYTGSLKNGQKFDSNTDSTFQHVKPYDFVVGRGEVIPGWDEGIKMFKAGGKGKLFVPAMLAYGPQSQGEKMPAFSDLIFDIEVLEVGVPTAPESQLPPTQ